MQLTSRQTLSPANYVDLRYEFIKQVEESGNVKLGPYVHPKRIPTIGVGINIQDSSNQRLVLEALGIDFRNKADQVYAAKLAVIIERTTYPATTSGTNSLRNDLDEVMWDRY